MTLSWINDLPLSISGFLIDFVFVLFGLAGLYAIRPWIRRLDTGHHIYNHVIGFYFAGATVLYAVFAGLLAIGAWETYTETEAKVDHEATALGTLYRDIDAYPEPARSVMEKDLRTYTRAVIDDGWPMQRRGIVPNNASSILDVFQKHFLAFQPEDHRQEFLTAEAYRAFNQLVESRRARLNSVKAEMPGPLWALVILGAAICIAVTWFLSPENFTLHFWMTVLFSGLLGLLIFLITVLDNPYRGRLGVSPEPLERVYTQIMVPPE